MTKAHINHRESHTQKGHAPVSRLLLHHAIGMTNRANNPAGNASQKQIHAAARSARSRAKVEGSTVL